MAACRLSPELVLGGPDGSEYFAFACRSAMGEARCRCYQGRLIATHERIGHFFQFQGGRQGGQALHALVQIVLFAPEQIGIAAIDSFGKGYITNGVFMCAADKCMVG